MCHSYNKNRKNLLTICPILNLQGSKGELCNDVSWVELQKKNKWFAFVPSIGVQRSSYSDIQKEVVDYGV